MTTDWTENVAEILNINPETISRIAKQRKLSFSDFLAISQAVENKDIDQVKEILMQTVNEQDVPSYTGGGASQLPRTPSLPTMQDTTIGDDSGDVEVGSGSSVVVKTLSGDPKQASVVRQRGADEFEVASPDNPMDKFIVKKDQIVSTLDESPRRKKK